MRTWESVGSALCAAVLAVACSSNRHADTGDAAVGDAPVAQVDAAMGDTAASDGGSPTPLPPSACGYTTTCVMGDSCTAAGPGSVVARAAHPSDTCTCVHHDPVSCLDHRVLALGLGYTCALVGDGIQCWGSNQTGELGNDTPTLSVLPIPVDDLAGLIPMIAGGGSYVCAIIEGAVKCWGLNDSGQLGDGKLASDEPSRRSPVQVVDIPPRAQAIAAGFGHVCAIIDGVVWCWGGNGFGELGIPAGAPRARPVQANVPTGALSIAAGGEHSCAIIQGAVWCWGDDQFGQLGKNLGVAGPTIASGAQAIALGVHHSCALVDGGVQCWGENTHGQLGDGSVDQRIAPMVVPGLETGVVAIGAGLFHSCALMATGTVKCWGDNTNAAVGAGPPSSTPVTSPVDVSDLPAAQVLSIGYQHSCAIADGTIYCWGANFSGELGFDPALGGLGLKPSRVQRLGCTGAPALSCRVTEGCANGTADQVFDGNLVGCAGTVAFSDRASLCGPGYRPATAAEWVAHHRSIAPAHDYWTDDQLRYNGTGSSACFVSTALGTACDPATPMRVCTATGTDAEGNQCDWTNCGLDASGPAEFFGGCHGDTTAGALCLKIQGAGRQVAAHGSLRSWPISDLPSGRTRNRPRSTASASAW